jgi:ribose transport system substrate-binding protein
MRRGLCRKTLSILPLEAQDMVRKLAVALALSGLLVGGFGCGETAGPEKGARGGKGEAELTFAVIPKADVFTFWPTVRKGAEKACEELGIEMIWRGAKDETSFRDEIEIVEAMMDRGVDGIVLAPQSDTALVDVVEEAVADGVPVVIIDSGLKSEKYVSFVATDNYQGGVIGAERLAEVIGEKGKVALIKNIPGSASTEQREKGFRETIAKFEDIELVAEQYAMGTPTKANEVVSTILNKHRDLAGIFTANEPGAIGALNAVANEGLVGKVKIVGFDASPTLIKGIRDGKLDSTIVQDPFGMGYKGVKALYDHIQGKDVPERLPTDLKLVTQENLDKPEIQKHLEAYGAAAKAE